MGNNARDGYVALGVFVVMVLGTLAVLSMFPQNHIAEHFTTTPAPPDAVQPVLSIFSLLDEALKTELRIGSVQWLHALIATVFGAFALMNGELVFKWLIVFTIFLMTFLLALSEVRAIFGPQYPRLLAEFIALEAGLGCAYAAFRGISGVMLAAGALLGFYLARQVQMLFLVLGHSQFSSNVWLVVVWYTILMLGGMRVMFKRKYRTVLSLLSSAFGGLFLAATVMWFVTCVSLEYSTASPWIVKGAWVDFLLMLTSSQAKDVGIFTQHAKVILHGEAFPVDRVVGCVLWLLLFIIGSVLQIKGQKEEFGVEHQVSRTWSSSSGFSSARERTTHPLKQPILEHADDVLA